jgi:aspartyl-tRNA(Asn)/glutamyl-tRNA(Gln) amidotransferase subunit A
MLEKNIQFATIFEIASMIRSGNTSSVAVTEFMLERIELLNDSLNAFITVTSKQAFEQAHAADKELASGCDRGPLHGIPVAIKDLFATQGIRTTAASKYYENWIPDYDATVVKRLSGAGAVLLGKTGMHEMAWGATSINSHFGAISNPWNLDYHPGGSSGGSAAAVAAGMAYAALGTDTGCSIRQPAQCCGIVGYKPTFGLVSKAGVIPLVWSLDHVGPLTRSVRDAALVLEAIAGFDQDDPYSADVATGDFQQSLDSSIANAQIGIPRRFFFEGGDPEVIGLVEKSLDIFTELGAKLIDIDVDGVEEAFAAIKVIFVEALAAHKDAWQTNPEAFSESIQNSFKAMTKWSASEYAEAQHFRLCFERQMAAVMEQCDVLVMPTSTVAAAPIKEQPANHARERWKNTSIFNLTGQPSISVPCGLTQTGLPAGLMIAGRKFEDAKVFQFAHAFERTTQWHNPRSPCV